MIEIYRNIGEKLVLFAGTQQNSAPLTLNREAGGRGGSIHPRNIARSNSRLASAAVFMCVDAALNINVEVRRRHQPQETCLLCDVMKSFQLLS